MKQRDRINYKQEYIDQLVEKIELVILNNHPWFYKRRTSWVGEFWGKVT